MTAALRPMTLGEILDRTIEIYRKQFLHVISIAALRALPIFGLQVIDSFWLHLNSLVPTGNRGRVMLGSFLISIGYYHVSSFLDVLVLPAYIRLTSDTTFGVQASARKSICFAAARWKSYLWIEILKQSVQLVIPEILALFLLLGTAVLVNMFRLGSTSFIILWPLIALLFGIFWIGLCLALVMPVAAMEELRGLQAFRRSWALSKNARIRITATWLMILACIVIVQFGLLFLLRRIIVSIYHVPISSIRSQHAYIVASHLTAALGSVFPGSLYPIALTLLYYDQRIRREGYDIERMMESAGLTVPVNPPALENGPELVAGENNA